MSKFRIHDPSTAPDPSQPVLAEAQKTLGFVPNLYGMLAESPALLQGYTTLSAIFAEGSLTPVERQVVLLSTSFENGCDYCMAAHTALAGMQGMPRKVIDRPAELPPQRIAWPRFLLTSGSPWYKSELTTRVEEMTCATLNRGSFCS